MNDKFNKTPTLIGEGVIFEGRIESGTLIRVEGTVVGDILYTESLVVGETGRIEGNVQADSVIVFGAVNGNLSAPAIEIRSGARVSGKITTQQLMMEKEAVYAGELCMGKALSKSSVHDPNK